jgi:PAS domain S-box-containing protein
MGRALCKSADVLREAHDEPPSVIDGDRATTDSLGPIRSLPERIAGLFSPRKPIPRDQELATRVLTGQFLVSLPILLPILVLRLALGTQLAETANLALIALITVNLIAALIFRSGRVYLSGTVLTFALWAFSTFISWTHPGIREGMVVVILLAALIAILALSARSSLTLAVLTMSSIVMLELRGLGRIYAASQTDRIFALVGSLLAVCDLTFVVRESLHRALRQTFATQQALSRSEGELSSILKKTPDIIYRLNPEGRIVYVNDAVRRYGYDPAKMVGTYLLDYVHPEDRDLAKHRVDERRTGDRSTKALEIRLLTRLGEERVAEYTALPVFRETVVLLQAEGLYENGTEPKRYLGTQGIARDITDRKRAEEALRKSEEKYSKVFQGAPVGVAVATLDGARFLDVNKEFERILGYSHDELLGRSALDIGVWVNPEQRKHIVDLLRRHESAQDLEVRLRTKHGELRTVRYCGQQVDIRDTPFLINTVVDITDRKRAEEALKKSEEKYAKVFRAVPAGVCVTSLDQARFLDVNEELERFLGFGRNELIGRSAFDIAAWVDPEERANIVDLLRRDEPVRDLEVHLRVKSGDVRTVRYNGQQIDIEGTACLLSAFEDITDRKRAEEALRKSEEKYAKVFHASPAGICIATLDEARFLDVNDEYEKTLGYSRNELIRSSALELGIWVDPAEREHIIDLLRSGRPAKDQEIHYRTKKGDVRVARYNAQLIDIGGTPCLVSAIEDITDRKRLESQLQQVQKLEAVGRLAGGIAHDFNNMLAVIIGQAEMASSGLVSTDSIYESIQEIRKAAERSAELTRQLLTFARRQDATPRFLDLNQAISERLTMLRRLMGENVILKWDPSPGLWSVKMDPVHIDQILLNLSVNARDAIPDIGMLAISTENRLRQGGRPEQAGGESPSEWVLLTVTDTGTGMSEESLAHLFEPFFTTKEIGKGTGMGLATVYGIVQRSGGWIEVESELRKGTTFRIYLPRAQGAVTGGQKADQTQLARGRETLLVVEDEQAILKIVRTTLQRLGYAVIEAASGRDALAVAAQHEGPVHLLLTDVIMPEMNGRDLYARIAALHPGIRVIFMSGYAADVFGQPDGGKEHFSFLQKPFSMQQLSAKVREILDRE